METEKMIVAIDLGSSSIVGVVGMREGDRIKITAVERVPSEGAVRRGCVVNVDEAASRVRKLVTMLENKLSAKIEKTYVAIAGQSVRSIRHTASRHLPEGTVITENLLADLYNEGRNFSIANADIVDIVPNEIVVNDFLVDNPVGMTATKIQIEMQLAVARQSITKNLRAVFAKLNLPIAGFILGVKADAEALLSKEDKKNGCVLVNFGGGTTTVSVYCGGFLKYFVTIPLGGKSITMDIISLGFVDVEAERFKITLGSALLSNAEQLKGITLEGKGKNSIKPKDLNKATVVRIEEIVANVVNQIKESGYRTAVNGGIVISGNASQLKDLPELLHKESGMEVRCGNVSSSVSADKDTDVNLFAYSQAVGMLMLGDAVCLSRERESVKSSSRFWLFGGDDKKQSEQKKPKPQQQPKQEKVEKTKPVKKKQEKEKQSGGIFDKIRNQIVDIIGEDDNETMK